MDPRTKKRHALLTFGYCGTGYYGVQSQTAEGDPSMPTLSDVIRQTLLAKGFIRESNFAPLKRTKWSLASRTDKGVHAVCAAASVMLETLPQDIELLPCDGTEPNGSTSESDLTSEERAEVESAYVAALDTIGMPADNWRLSDAAVERINAALPPEVRVFSASRVRKRFDAREQASSRVYEYVLPLSALGGGSVEQFDTALRCFEGTYRFHNFASGLRRLSTPSDFVCEGSGETWPFAMDQRASSAAFRSVLSCRVQRELTLGEGEPYLVVRIAGVSFVLHQIRHMIGTALAVVRGAVPLDAVTIALRTNLRIDISPLVPGHGLLLDEIQWFDVKEGTYEALVPSSARASMDAFKAEVVYPHIHSLYDQGAFDFFLGEVHNIAYSEEDYNRLRRVYAAYSANVAEKAAHRRERRAQAREEAKALGGQTQHRRARKPKENELPGGMMTTLCVSRQLLPGPETHAAITLLKARIADGQLEAHQPYSYYLDQLDRELPADT